MPGNVHCKCEVEFCSGIWEYIYIFSIKQLIMFNLRREMVHNVAWCYCQNVTLFCSKQWHRGITVLKDITELTIKIGSRTILTFITILWRLIMELCSASDALNIPQVLLKVHDDKLKSVSYKLTQKKERVQSYNLSNWQRMFPVPTMWCFRCRLWSRVVS